MARTPSVMIELGTRAHDFTLPDVVSGKALSLHDLKGEKGTLIAFICVHCPFVKHVNSQLVQLAKDYANKGIMLIAISANDAAQYPEDGPEGMKQAAEQLGYTFPYLYDETQATAKAYQAACTPDFFIFDKGLVLVYRGQLDDSRPGNGVPVTGSDIRLAFDAILNNLPVRADQKPSIGCNIKWK